MSPDTAIAVDPSPPASAPRVRRHRWVLGLMMVLMLPLACAGVGLLYVADVASRTERAAVAEADRTDPGWRLADIEAARPAVPDAENAALVVRRAYRAMIPGKPYPRPRPTTGAANLSRLSASVEAQAVAFDEALSQTLFEEFAEDLEADAAALEVARGLSGMRRGRYPSAGGALGFLRPWPRAIEVASVARLLQADATMQAQRGDGDAAIRAVRAILGASASLGDEPGMSVALNRLSLDRQAVQALERTLGQGTASDGALALLDADLAFEDARPLLTDALRTERAIEYEAFGGVAARASTRGVVPPGVFGSYSLRGPHVRAWFRYIQGRSLAQMNAALAIAARPSHEQKPLLAAWVGEYLPNPRPRSAMVLVDAPLRMLTAMGGGNPTLHFHEAQARLRAGRVAIAMERFRLAHGRWPADDSEVAVPGGYPRDPFLDAPIRRSRTPEGWAIYSVGVDGKDHGGAFDRMSAVLYKGDAGLTLLDPPGRRRTAPPRPGPQP